MVAGATLTAGRSRTARGRRRGPSKNPASAKGPVARGVDFVAGKSLRLAGRVEAPGLPFGSLDASVLDARTGEVVAGAEPDAEGGFRIEGLFAAAYDVVLSCDGRELAREAVGPAGATDLVLRAR